jgi:DNA replicative helicase MCM subunit Mcm2 (Cdc46/Mcm family)
MGELPRSLQLVADRMLVGAIAPGTRVTAVGIYSIYQARAAAARTAAARLLGPTCSLYDFVGCGDMPQYGGG